MRALGIGMLVAGAALLAYGVYSAIAAFTADDLVGQTTHGGWAMGGVIAGVVLMFSGRRLSTMAPASVKGGVAGYGQVSAVHDTGVSTNSGTTLHVQADITASAPGIAPYPAKVRIKLGRTQWGAIQPGMSVPILIDPTDHSKVAFDVSRPVQAAAAGAAPGGPGVTVRSGADLISQGVPVMGTLFSAQPSGITAGQVSPGLPPDQADDPVFTVTFGYPGPDGQQLTTTAMVRVPDGKQLVPNMPVPVSYLADQPNTATIDWTRLP
jgi:hypothetical protein